MKNYAIKILLIIMQKKNFINTNILVLFLLIVLVFLELESFQEILFRPGLAIYFLPTYCTMQFSITCSMSATKLEPSSSL